MSLNFGNAGRIGDYFPYAGGGLTDKSGLLAPRFLSPFGPHFPPGPLYPPPPPTSSFAAALCKLAKQAGEPSTAPSDRDVLGGPHVFNPLGDSRSRVNLSDTPTKQEPSPVTTLPTQDISTSKGFQPYRGSEEHLSFNVDHGSSLFNRALPRTLPYNQLEETLLLERYSLLRSPLYHPGLPFYPTPTYPADFLPPPPPHGLYPSVIPTTERPEENLRDVQNIPGQTTKKESSLSITVCDSTSSPSPVKQTDGDQQGCLVPLNLTRLQNHPCAPEPHEKAGPEEERRKPDAPVPRPRDVNQVSSSQEGLADSYREGMPVRLMEHHLPPELYKPHLHRPYGNSVSRAPPPLLSKLDREVYLGDRASPQVDISLTKGPPLPLDENPQKLLFLQQLGLVTHKKKNELQFEQLMLRCQRSQESNGAGSTQSNRVSDPQSGIKQADKLPCWKSAEDCGRSRRRKLTLLSSFSKKKKKMLLPEEKAFLVASCKSKGIQTSAESQTGAKLHWTSRLEDVISAYQQHLSDQRLEEKVLRERCHQLQSDKMALLDQMDQLRWQMTSLLQKKQKMHQEKEGLQSSIQSLKSTLFPYTAAGPH